MDQKTITLTVKQLDEVKPSQKGTPQRGVLTEAGWIKVRGASVAFLDVGTRIEVSEPTEFPAGSGRKYAELKAMGAVDAPKAPAPAAPGSAPMAPPPPAGAPAPRAPAPSYSNGAIKFDDYVRAVKNFYGLATALAPDILVPVETKEDGSKVMGVQVDRAQARAAMVNTFSIALTSGKIDMSEPAREPGADDVPPWEKQAAAK